MILEQDHNKLTGFRVINSSVLVYDANGLGYFGFHADTDSETVSASDQIAMFITYHVLPNLKPEYR